MFHSPSNNPSVSGVSVGKLSIPVLFNLTGCRLRRVQLGRPLPGHPHPGDPGEGEGEAKFYFDQDRIGKYFINRQ